MLPSATEMLYALGVEPVGVSHECDYPPEAESLPSVTASRVDPEATSQEINREVAQAVEEDGVYNLDVDLLESLDPDVVVTQGVCEVCAVDSALVEDAVREISSDPIVVNLHPHTLPDVLEEIREVGRAVGREERAREAVTDLEERIQAVEGRCTDLDRPRVAVVDWMDPVMVAGHWVPGLVEKAGGRYGMEEAGVPSRPREWSEVVSYAPEVLLVAPCGYELSHTVRDFDELSGRQGWGDLPAVRDDRVYALDGHHLVNRPGPRLVDTLEVFMQAIHTDRFGEPPADAATKPVRVR